MGWKISDMSHYENYAEIELEKVCQLVDGEQMAGIPLNYLDAKYLRGKSDGTKTNSGRYVKKGSYMILVDGENSGEIFIAPEDGYCGSTFKLLTIDSSMDIEYVLWFIRSHQKKLRDSKVGSAIPHLNKKLFKSLMIPQITIEEQKRIISEIKLIFVQLDKILENLV